ncbi:zinc-ribbon domain containing protein, partial [Cytobacillus praedii]
YEYSIILDHLYNDSYYSLGEVSVTNRILDMTDLVGIVDYINNLIKNHKLHRKCSDCGKLFNLTSDEVKFYKSKDFELPKRCKSCRSNRKHNKLIN